MTGIEISLILASRMQDGQGQSTLYPQPTQDQVSSVKEPKNKPGGKKKILVILFVVVFIAALAGAGWFIFSDPDVDEADGISSTLSTPETRVTSTATPSPTPKPLVRSEIKIIVLNGSGVPGQASELSEDLEALGYENIEVDNADEQDKSSTTMVYSSSVSTLAVDEITELLEKTYEKVTVQSGSTGEYDIKITTGYKKGYEPSPVEEEEDTTPTPTKKVTSTPTE